MAEKMVQVSMNIKGVKENTIDVLVAFHRNDSFLDQCIESILSSRGVQVRLILADDRPLIEQNIETKWNEYIKIRTSGLEGFEYSINKLSNHLKSEFVTIVGSDDLIDKNKLIRQINLLKENNLDLIICKFRKIDEKNKIIKFSAPFPSLKKFRSEWLLINSYGADATWVCTRKWWEDNYILNKSPVHDWELGFRVLEKTSIGIIDEELASYRMHKNQSTRSVARSNANDYRAFCELWRNKSKSLHLPELSDLQILALTMPWSFNFKDFDLDIIQMSMWLDDFRNLIGNDEFSELKPGLELKSLYLFYRYRVNLKIPSQWQIYTYCKVILRLLKMGFKSAKHVRELST